MNIGLGKGVLNKEKQLVSMTEETGHEVVAGDVDVHCCAGHLVRNPRRAGRLIRYGGRRLIIRRWKP